MADIRINALATTATTPASDDYLALDGAAQGTRKILATNIANNVTDVILGASGPSVKSTLSARAPRQGLVFDGTATNAPVSNVPAFGTGDFTLSAVFFSPTDVTGGSRYYVIMGGTYGATTCPVFGYYNGTVFFNRATGPAAITAPCSSGKSHHVAITRSGETYKIYVDGVVGYSGAYGSGQDFTAGVTALGQLTNEPSNSVMLGTIAQPLIYNRALSAAEVVALYEAGAPSAGDYNTASNTAINTSSFVNFASYQYTTFTSASATGFSATYTGSTLAAAQSQPFFSVSKGQQFLVTFSLTLNSGQLPTVILENSSLGDASASATATAGSNSFVLTSTVYNPSVALSFLNSAATDFVVSNVSVKRLGLLLAPDAAQAGNGYVWNDQSGNLAQIVLPSSGVAWNLPSVAGNRIRGTTSTNGNQQLLGASTLLPAECQILYVRARAQSGTPTITIGTASGGAQIVASVALSTTWLNCTIALTGGIVSSADDIWVGSNSTDVVETDIAFQPLDF